MKSLSHPPAVLTIAGSDSCGGAGIQADLKTFAALRCHGASVVTAITAQNTRGVRSWQALDARLVQDQVDAVLEDLSVKAIKIGLLGSQDIIRMLAKRLRNFKGPIVLDPILASSSGKLFLDEETLTVLRKELIPLISLLTPNLPESKILGRCPKTPCLLKGGHRRGKKIRDELIIGKKRIPFVKERIGNATCHGTGCVLSSAIASYLALGHSMVEALRLAEAFMDRPIQFSQSVGRGKSIVHPSALIFHEADCLRALEAVRTALCLFERKNIRNLIPEIGSNFVVATDTAESTDEMAGVEGRITKSKEGIHTGLGPWMGVSDHMARLLVAVRRVDSSYRAAMNVRYSESAVQACKRLGLRGGTFSRRDEPRGQRNQERQTLPWALRHIVRQQGGIPDFIADKGDLGKEAIIRLLAKDPEELMERVVRISSLTYLIY